MVQPTQAGHGIDGCVLCWLLLHRPSIRRVLSQGIVNTFLMVQLSNTTPILGIFVKTAIPDTHGKAGQRGCMQLRQSADKRWPILSWHESSHLTFCSDP